MRSVTVDGGTVRVRFTGTDALWALSRGLEVPLTDVEAVEVVDRSAVPRGGLRLPGTHLPGVIRAGSYRHRDGWELANVRRGRRVLHLRLRNHRYRDVWVEVDDPDGVAARIGG